MKLKPSINLLLVAGVATGMWLWLRPRPGLPVKPVLPVASLDKPEVVPSSPRQTALSETTILKPIPLATHKLVGVKTSTLTPSWSAVQKIVDQNTSPMERQKAIRSLAGHMTDLDWEVLEPFLLRPDGLDKVQTGQVIKNELMDVLCAMNPPPASLGDDLIKIYRDRQQGEVIRDYAVQHLSAYYEQISTQPNSAPAQSPVPTLGLFSQHQASPNSVSAQASIQAALWEAVQEPDGSIAGTALLALERLSQEYPEFDQGKIAATALQMVNDTQAGELTHITAYQVCGQLANTDALPAILSAAQNGETISVRMSAIGTLGSLGGVDQIPFLNEVLAGTEDRLKLAAQHALDQINARQNQMATQK